MQDAATLYLTQGSGNNVKPMMVCNHLGLKCNRKYIDVLAGETKKPAFLSINPQGVVPYLVLADGQGLGESNAIAWYLAENSSLIPETTIGRAQAIRWMNFEQTALEPNISPVRFVTFVVPELEVENKDMIPLWRERGANGLNTLSKHLEAHDFMVEETYSVADIAVYGYTHLAREGGFDLDAFKPITDWIERIENQPGYASIHDLLDGINFESDDLAA